MIEKIYKNKRMVVCDNCGGNYTMLDCLKRKCGYLQFKECKEVKQYCVRRKDGQM